MCNMKFKKTKSLPAQITRKTLQAIELRQERWEHGTVSPLVLIAVFSPDIHLWFSVNSHNWTHFHYILDASFNSYHMRIYGVVTLEERKNTRLFYNSKNSQNYIINIITFFTGLYTEYNKISKKQLLSFCCIVDFLS